jgi:hypothetical protein
MWDLIDHKMDQLMDPNQWSGNEERAEIVGYLRGAAEMLATFLNCYRPDVDAIRTQAMARWQERNADG